jgi:xanthine/CO dehydrogenase XdhC/CoxF family maturation factor
LGCDGIIDLMLQRLDRERGFEFLEQLEASHGSRCAVLIALATQSNGGLPLASSALLDRAGNCCGEPVLLEILHDISRRGWPDWRYQKTCDKKKGEAGETILVNIPPQTRVLVCGAGPDAVPVVRALCALDWDVFIADHRPAYARAGRFPDNCRVIQARPEKLAEFVDLEQIDAAIVMSHHLENDGIYLAQLAKNDLDYVGCLGPRARRDRLKELAGCPGQQVYGPVGLDIGAELPEAIALSLVAEIHAVLNRRSGLPLTPPNADVPTG